MAIYNLDKTSTMDQNGRILYNYIHNNLISYKNISICDNSDSIMFSFDNMFRDCSNVVNIDLTNLGLNSLSYINNAFRGCSNLQNIINLNANVRYLSWSGNYACQNIFSGCNNLISITGNLKLNVSNLVSMFYGLNKLKTLPNIEILNYYYTTVNLAYAFYNCSNLNTINIKLDKVNGLHTAFYNCYNLKSISNMNTSLVTDLRFCFFTLL